MTNARHLRGSAWLNFRRVLCERWSHENLVLMGDAAATAHFSVGSGTKLALESAIGAGRVPAHRAGHAGRLPALRAGASNRGAAAPERGTQFDRVVRADRPVSPSRPGAVQLLAAHALAAHQPREPAGARQGLARERRDVVRGAGDGREAPSSSRPPMFTPFRLRDLRLKNRIVVSPMAQYRAVDGTPTDWHLVHYAERAKGGAGLVMTEMTCVSPEGRITPGCAGLYAPDHEAAWKRIVDFVHAETDARIGMQLGHSGPKGSTQLGWQTMDAPLPEDNWPVIAPSPIAWSPHNQIPREMTRADMDRVRESSCARRQWRRAPASICSSCTARTAISCRRSSRRSPTGAPTPTAGRSRTECAFRSRSTMPCGRSGRRRSRSRSVFPPTTGSASGDHAGRCRRDCAPAAGRRRRHHQCVGGTDVDAGAAGLRPHVPDAVLRSHSQRDRHRHDGRRQHLRARSRELDSDGGTRGPVLPRAAASCRSVLDAACRGATRLSRRDLAASRISPGRDQLYRLASRSETTAVTV